MHLLPSLGDTKLDEIKTADVQRLKHDLRSKSPKTVNNVLTFLNVLLKKAVEWGIIDGMPCAIKLLPISKPAASFHDFDSYERLVETARANDWRTHLIVLLGGEAGLRAGEMVALHWSDVDFANSQLCVRHSDYRGQLTTPKNGRIRFVPLTRRLAIALREHRHLRSPRVLCRDDGRPLTRQSAWLRVRRVVRTANVPTGGHILRHTFWSHLAMRGAPGKAIQELAGHQELGTTSRYMHLSPAARQSAIRLLEPSAVQSDRGDILATAEAVTAN